jgi:hypothetical protein
LGWRMLLLWVLPTKICIHKKPIKKSNLKIQNSKMGAILYEQTWLSNNFWSFLELSICERSDDG